ncbi:hypothetical protein MKX03_028288 [Papaver bracteatum]|nr:hypothetical protein MKX03_028288 [Papaver bracteatum]
MVVSFCNLSLSNTIGFPLSWAHLKARKKVDEQHLSCQIGLWRTSVIRHNTCKKIVISRERNETVTFFKVTNFF